MMDIDTPYPPLDLANSTIFITGGSSGIGLGLAELLLKAGATVVTCGRRADALKAAAEKLPGLKTFVGDVATAGSRTELFHWIRDNAPDTNVLINNAGIQRRVNWKDDHADWAEKQTEIDINCAGPVHLTHLFGEWFVSKGVDSAIVNVTSGLAYLPAPFAAVYGASKAFMHSFTQAVRFHFKNSKVQIVELAPPAVKSKLGGSHDLGMETADFCQQAFDKLAAGHKEFGVELSEDARLADRPTRLMMMDKISKMFDIQPY